MKKLTGIILHLFARGGNLKSTSYDDFTDNNVWRHDLDLRTSGAFDKSRDYHDHIEFADVQVHIFFKHFRITVSVCV